MKQHNEELSDRAETSEYQIAAISKEYRNLVQQKEVCNASGIVHGTADIE